MVAAGDKAAIRATYRDTGKGGFIPGMPATGKTFAMVAIYLVRINEQGQVADTGRGRQHRHRGPARPAARRRPGARLTAPIDAYSPRALTPTWTANDRELIVLRQAKGSCRLPWRLSATAPRTLGAPHAGKGHRDACIERSGMPGRPGSMRRDDPSQVHESGPVFRLRAGHATHRPTRSRPSLGTRVGVT
jgi:hypothetical protein